MEKSYQNPNECENNTNFQVKQLSQTPNYNFHW